jgi:hypothetical protein
MLLQHRDAFPTLSLASLSAPFQQAVIVLSGNDEQSVLPIVVSAPTRYGNGIHWPETVPDGRRHTNLIRQQGTACLSNLRRHSGAFFELSA